MILLDILPKGERVNADRYCERLDRLRHAVRRKRPGVLSSGVVVQHDNATPHTPKRTKEWLELYRWDIIPHPAHSPDLAPSDFHLFGPLKRYLKTSFLSPDTGITAEGKRVTIIQYLEHRQYLRTEKCSRARDCNACECAQEQTLVPAVTKVDNSIGVQLVMIPGGCKCFNHELID
ncbi:histone-lysine N-methyltransferase SETMAR [Plakobranchus ocellatus]|uniref:Histone-lysine N-methyltransferase SETMAR n=1 Tax=Plakobranchus ocellatus TaxID=259542 RepID=A0AAV4BFT6_9GAST|nr:histone-lysine N-methyltransferase SETMAR [Plakobranchus ocellatus]